jgi:uncharacterized membrane protein YidH (DUF202 family)
MPVAGAGYHPSRRRSNQYSFTAIVVGAIYIGLALATGFVLLGFIPVLSAVRAMRAKEPLAPVAMILSVIVIVVALTTLAHH